ncbi:Mov34/MPN/PAD-1 family protein [Mesorhizobium silamurunense]|uniref:Mov34/MPN/PAD-1 family protein n=1 Tax=Mesorhizobium silamurunense TaxID=499528 RepID=UPI00177C5BC9|nr:Mov34/MPN/PAD-1 family protein [Mesorhizobium silamurunense]
MSFSPLSLISRLLGWLPDLSIPTEVWRDLLHGLRVRGRGHRESGAFLLGSKGKTRRVTSIVFYDEVDPAAFDTGIIEIDGGRMAELWRICRERNLIVVADVHTHPGGAGQSDSDRTHPMIAEPGHVALILPHFAAEPVILKEIGLYRYLGGFRWERPRPSLYRPTLMIGGKAHG